MPRLYQYEPGKDFGLLGSLLQTLRGGGPIQSGAGPYLPLSFFT